MNCLVWNCLGAGKVGFDSKIRYLFRRNHVDLCVLLETCVSSLRAQEVCESFRITNCFRVEARDFSGGIWLLWDGKKATVQVISSQDHLVRVSILKGGVSTQCILVHAPPFVHRRRRFWVNFSLKFVKLLVHFLSSERLGGLGLLHPDSAAFQNLVDEAGLVDMGFMGHPHTWSQARISWLEATVKHLPKLSSDHTSLLISLEPPRVWDYNRRPFRFEVAWLTHPDFVAEAWTTCCNASAALDKMRLKLLKWNKKVFCNIQLRKDELMAELDDVQTSIQRNVSLVLMARDRELHNILAVTLEQEELLWLQKSRVKWLREGDKNTTLFHAMTIIQRRRNKLEALLDDNDSWVNDKLEHENLARVVNSFTRGVVSSCPPLRSISRDSRNRIVAPMTNDGIITALKHMGPLKAPRPNGFKPVFFQKCHVLLHLLCLARAPE
ncbi:hypothetical protein V2J09_008854 [Rumex salicifolius]